MKRIVLAVATISAAAVLAAAPAFAGLIGNSSFSHQIPVPVPSGAHRVQQVDDHLAVVSATPPAAKPSPSQHSEPGDDRGGSTTRAAEPGDDRGGATSTRSPEPGDDRGGATTVTSRSPEPGDDRGGATSGTSGKGGNGGSDDPSGHH
jgi:hypothetical protein